LFIANTLISPHRNTTIVFDRLCRLSIAGQRISARRGFFQPHAQLRLLRLGQQGAFGGLRLARSRHGRGLR
jgi:hypothetical protein